MHCVTVNLTPHRVHARRCRFGGLRRTRQPTTSKNLVLFALDCFEQVPELYSRARGPRLAIPCPTKRSDPSHNTVPMCRAGVRADAALGEAVARVQAGARCAPGLDPSTAERRCSAPVAPPPPNTAAAAPMGVGGAAEARRGGVRIGEFFFI